MIIRHSILILILILLGLILYSPAESQKESLRLSLEDVVYKYAMKSAEAKIESMKYENELLNYENFKKGDLPSISLNVSPFNFNRSFVKLQNATDGQYHYVEDYSSNSSLGVNISQNIGLTGGHLSINSNLNYLNELSRHRHSFSTVPLSINYSQKIFGGRKAYRMEHEIEKEKNKKAVSDYCIKISNIQEQVMNLFMDVFLAKLEIELSIANKRSADTLLIVSKFKYDNNNMTEQDYRQMELQALNDKYMYESAEKSYSDAMQSLITYLCLPYGIYEIVMETPEFTLPKLIDFNDVLFYADKNNTTEQQMTIKRLEAERNLFNAKLNNMVNSDINITYGINQYATKLIDAYRNPARQQSISIGLSIPVFQWGINRNRTRIAENIYKIQMIEIEQEKKRFDDDLKTKVNSYNRNINMWLLAERTYELTKQQYHSITHLFTIGKATVYELTTAHREQITAMKKYYDALHETWISFFSIRNITLYDFCHEKELMDFEY